MEGLYLYCIRERNEDTPALSVKGIDGKEEAYTLIFNDLEAIVSKISFEEFASEEIQRRAQEDLNWIREKALNHARVIQEVMGKDHIGLGLIPMRFGIVFKDIARLEESLEKDYFRIVEVLKRIRGKQEWSVKAYLKDRKAFEEKIKEENEVIREKEKEIASLPEGMAFFMEEELKEVISREEEKKLNNIGALIFEGLKKQAADAARCKILERELTGRLEPMVLNAAYLIPEERVEDFKKEIEKLNQRVQAKGLSVECSGPWPPYNFI